MKAADRQTISRLYVRKRFRRAMQRVTGGFIWLTHIFKGAPEKLLVAPTDLRAADPYMAEEIVNGRFTLAGRTLEVGNESPFSFEMPTLEFELKLHAFGWLRDFRATKDEQYFAKAQALTSQWVYSYRRPDKSAVWQPDVTAQRLISWLSHSPVILRGAEMGFYRRFLRSLGRHIEYLQSVAGNAADGQERLLVRVALAMATLAMPAKPGEIQRAGQNLDRELDRQILADGGHISRNPRAILDLLLDLLPLRQTYLNLGHEVPAGLIPAIDRMFPALRFFRHQGGELALFNGATATLAIELASVLRYDESSGEPFKALPYMQYHRLAVNGTVLIMDTGNAISQDTSGQAHAGCLSFEMSSGKNRFMINSGSPRLVSGEYKQLARATAAHTTVVVNDTSSLTFSKSEYLGSIVTGGIRSVNVARREDGKGEGINARHDGYLALVGLLHERDLQIGPGGGHIRGRDRLVTREGREPDSQNNAKAVARFHIHPAISISRVDRHEVLLKAPDGLTWSFSCIDADVIVSEDVFFADPSGIRASQQLELEFDAAGMPDIQWIMELRSPQKL
jgi:uncharacterized heparinase superfamily protein